MVEREIGGYLELERFSGQEYHEGALALDCARNALAYLIEARDIHTLWLPDFLCTSPAEVCRERGVKLRTFGALPDLTPDLAAVSPEGNAYLYLVDHYGQLPAGTIHACTERFEGRVIVDEVMAFFRRPEPGIDTLYSCRKFLGVADGAYLYTTAELGRVLPVGSSRTAMDYVLGRLEDGAGAHFAEAQANNSRFVGQPIELMSPITHNLLRAVDYDRVRARREENWRYLHERLGQHNELALADVPGPFMYPLLVPGGSAIRRELQQRKVYVPTLWPQATEAPGATGRLARDILPLPIDQRYTTDDMAYVADLVEELL